VVPDEAAEIVAAVNHLRAKYTYLFTTGGIGPTHDDITADCVAKAFGVRIDVDPRALAIMQPYYAKRGLELTPARLRMARLPEGSELVENKVSIAPGFRMHNVIVMAGIPNIMQVMLDAVTPQLRTGRKMLSETLELLRPEGEIADLFGAHQQDFADVSMGSYPFTRDAKTFGTHLVLRATDPDRLAAAFAGLKTKLAAKGFL
jgi:molybdopterin-biosynthesis enzyme MoeA-like protein